MSVVDTRITNRVSELRKRNILTTNEMQTDCDVAQVLQVSLKRGIWFIKMHLCRAALLGNLHFIASVPLYLRIYVVVIRHYAPNAEGLVYLQKAVLSTLAV